MIEYSAHEVKKIEQLLSRHHTNNAATEDELPAFYAEILAKADPTVSFLYARATGAMSDDDFRAFWQENNVSVNLTETTEYKVFKELYTPNLPDLSNFPKGSFLIEIEFVLAKPYLSKNDNDFYILENSIQRDKVFRIPMLRPSGWKGALSAALFKLSCRPGDQRWLHLFGEANDSDELISKGKAGRLHISPSFFSATGLEILNPHDRKSRKGNRPIVLESVPANSKSTFILFYMPYDAIGREPKESAMQISQDVEILLRGLKGMFTTYGFGAKTSSGFGIAEDACKIVVRINGIKTPIFASSFTEMASEQKIKEITDSIHEAGN